MNRIQTVLTILVCAYTGTACSDSGQPVERLTQAVESEGLHGEYFENTSLSGDPTQERVDATVNFNWGNDSPFAGSTFPADNFSVRWTGKITPLYSETYTFYLYVYDGARLWVNGQLLIDDWAWDEGEEQGSIALTAGIAYDIQLEYKENSGAAVAQLSWSSASQSKEIVPQTQLSTDDCGSTDDPPPPDDDPPPDALFSADFESEDATCWATRNSSGYTTSACGIWQSIGKAPASLADGERARSGTRAFKAMFTNNEDSAMARLSTDLEHVFVRYYDYYDTDFDFAAGMKTLRLQSFNDAEGVNYYDVIAYSTAVPTSGSYDYCGINDMKSLAISKNPGFRWEEVSLSMERNRWYAVETELKLNTPGSLDGAVRVWVDGQLVLEETGIDIRGSDPHGIDRISIGGWYSNSAGGNNSCPDPAAVSRRYIDDVVVSTQYIGP